MKRIITRLAACMSHARGGILTGVMLVAVSSTAFAWDGAVSGTVTSVEVNGEAEAFRVYIAGVSSMCGNSNNWAYLAVGDANYNAYVAVVISAKALGSSISVYTTRDASGYCHIGDIAMQ
jgi:hypothetical protein